MKTDVIKRAICEELDRRRALIESSLDLRSIMLDVKLSPDSGEPRTVIFLPNFERRKVPRS